MTWARLGDMFVDQPQVSRRTAIQNAAINPFITRGVRAIKMVMEHHTDSGGSVAAEAERVAKHALLLMLTRYFNEDDLVMLADTTSLNLPKALAESSSYDIRRSLDGKSEDVLIDDDFDHEDGPELKDYL